MREGRIARKLRTMLEAEGFVVTHLTGAVGAWRKAGVSRWCAVARKDGSQVIIESWDTMTKCVRGFSFVRSGSSVEVHASTVRL